MPLAPAVRRCETAMEYAVLLLLCRGDRAEAAGLSEDSAAALDTVLGSPAGPVRRADREPWQRAVNALGLRSWLWFLVTVALAVTGLLVPRATATDLLVITVAALPAALFAARQAGHLLARRSLERGRLLPGGRAWLARWAGGAGVALLYPPAWAAWALVFQPWG